MNLQYVTKVNYNYYFQDKDDPEKWYFYDAWLGHMSRCTFDHFKNEKELFEVEK